MYVAWLCILYCSYCYQFKNEGEDNWSAKKNWKEEASAKNAF